MSFKSEMFGWIITSEHGISWQVFINNDHSPTGRTILANGQVSCVEDGLQKIEKEVELLEGNLIKVIYS